MLPIKGLQKMSLIDYSPYSSCVVFIGGCNFRCPYCQNPKLVINVDEQPTLTEDEIFKFLETRKEWLDAVVITGGEPTLYKELKPFIESIKSMGYKVKLDTNGTNPELLKKIMPMLDYIAMDIKAPLDMYDNVTQIKTNTDNIKKSIKLIKTKAKDYEFRTTIIKDFFKGDDVIKIGEILKGSKKYTMQQFRQNMPILDESYKKVKPYTKEELEKFKTVLDNYFDEVEIKGTY